MLVNLGDTPLAGFDEPLAMMKDCHRRIEYFLDLLRKVEQQFGDRELADDARRALNSAVNYFAEFAPRHTADEESSLFPRLRNNDSSEARAVLAEVERLEGDHRVCDAGHAAVDVIVRQWMAAGRIDQSQRDRLRSILTELAAIYSAHIELEEHRVFEVAARMLSRGEVRQIGEEMKQRRSLAKPEVRPAASAN